MRMRGMVRQDFIFQFRHGFYLIYAVVTLVYSVILFFVPAGYRTHVATDLIFTDTAVLGFFFIGGIVLLERSDQLLESLFISPLKVSEYVASKLISLGFLSIVCTAILLLVSGMSDADLVVLIITGTILSSAMFTSIGICIAVKAKTVNQYFLYSIGFMFLFAPVILDVAGILQSPLFYLFPVRGIVDIILRAAGSRGSGSLVPAFISMGSWTVFSFLLACRILLKSIRNRGGEHSWIRL